MATPDILDTAARLVRRHGVDALTMDSLAEAAGVSRATLYRQLGSREALLEQLAERGVDIGDRSDVRARILGACAITLPRLGIEATTVEAVAEAAGVGVATVYRHFGDKRGLIEAFLSGHMPRKAAWALARDPSGDLRADLEQLARTALTFMRDHHELFRLALVERARGSETLIELSRSSDRTLHACAALLGYYAARGELREVGGGPAQPATPAGVQALARAFIGIIFSQGMFESLLGVPGSPDPERDARFAVELFLRGAQRRGPRRPAAPRPRKAPREKGTSPRRRKP